MIILYSMTDVPATICCDFLKAGILPPEERLAIVPLERSFFLYHVPNHSFVATDQNLILYKAGPLGGPRIVEKIPLPAIAACRCEPAETGLNFIIEAKGDREYALPLAIGTDDGARLVARLTELVQTAKEEQ